MAYPLWLRAFHSAAPPGSELLLLGAFSMPLVAAVHWWRLAGAAPRTALELRARRLALLAAGAPPLFVWLAFALRLIGWPLPEFAAWAVFWCGASLWVLMGPRQPTPGQAVVAGTTARIAHGVVAVLVLGFVGFHLLNHLIGLLGPDAHAAVMQLGRRVYRLPAVEGLLVVLMLVQLGLGIGLAWRWSRQAMDKYRAVQVVTGVYLGFFVLTHMNSALISARLLQGINTDWAWASGAPRGLLADAWNIRLLPHYGLGVFCVVTHLICGGRVVLLAHGFRERTVNRAFALGLVAAVSIAFTVVAVLCGFRLRP